MAEMVRVLRATNGRRPGEKFFARAKGDVRQKWSGGYAPPMTDVRAKNISPLQIEIGDAKNFANIMSIDRCYGGDLATG